MKIIQSSRLIGETMRYKQDTPNDQIIVFASAIGGYAGNIGDKIGGCICIDWLNVDDDIDKVKLYAEEICKLARMTQKEFDDEKKSQSNEAD